MARRVAQRMIRRRRLVIIQLGIVVLQFGIVFALGRLIVLQFEQREVRCEGLRGAGEESLRWFELLQSSGEVPDSVRDQLFVRRLAALASAGKFPGPINYDVSGAVPEGGIR